MLWVVTYSTFSHGQALGWVDLDLRSPTHTHRMVICPDPARELFRWSEFALGLKSKLRHFFSPKESLLLLCVEHKAEVWLVGQQKCPEQQQERKIMIAVHILFPLYASHWARHVGSLIYPHPLGTILIVKGEETWTCKSKKCLWPHSQERVKTTHVSAEAHAFEHRGRLST